MNLENTIVDFVDECAKDVFCKTISIEARLEQLRSFYHEWCKCLQKTNDYIGMYLMDEIMWCDLLTSINQKLGICSHNFSCLDPFFESLPILGCSFFHKERHTRNWEIRRTQYLQNEHLMKSWLDYYIDKKLYECINALMISNVLPDEFYQQTEIKSRFHELARKTKGFGFIKNQEISVHLCKLLFIDIKILIACVEANHYSAFDALCNIPWNRTIMDDACFYAESLTISCLTNEDVRFIDRLTMKTEILYCLLLEYYDPDCTTDDIKREKMLMYQFKNNININSMCFNILYERTAVYFAGFANQLSSELIEITLIPQFKALRECTSLIEPLCVMVMLYLHCCNWKASDDILSKFLNQL